MSTSLCRLKIGVRSSWSSTLLVKKKKRFMECYFLALPSSPLKLIILYMCAKIKYFTPAAKPLCIHICTTVITVVQLSAITFYDLTFLLNIFPKNDQALYHNEYYRHYLSLTGHWKLTFCILCIIFLRRIR